MKIVYIERVMLSKWAKTEEINQRILFVYGWFHVILLTCGETLLWLIFETHAAEDISVFSI